MNKKTLSYLAYFTLVLSIVGFKVVETLFTGSVVIGYRTELRELSQQKVALEQTLAQNTATIQLAQAVTGVGDEALSFEPITTPLQVSLHQHLALK